MTQYKRLFSDRKYILLMYSGGVLFSVLGILGGVLVQEIVIWGFEESTGTVLSSSTIVTGLLATVIYSQIASKLKDKLRVFIVMGVLCTIAIGGAVFSILTHNVPLVFISAALYASFIYIGFIVSLELIEHQVGHSLELIATANSFVIGSLVMASGLFGLGYLLNDKSKKNSIITLYIMGGIHASALLALALLGFEKSKTTKHTFSKKGKFKMGSVVSDDDKAE